MTDLLERLRDEMRCGDLADGGALYHEAAVEIERLRAALEPSVIKDVWAERRRQIEEEGWSPRHDKAHINGELAQAAACYALHSIPGTTQAEWPWAPAWWKPKDNRRNLVRAAALIVAEIERLDRAAASGNQDTVESAPSAVT